MHRVHPANYVKLVLKDIIVQATYYDTVSSALDDILRKGFDEQAEIIRLCNRVTQSLPKSKDFNGYNSLKKKNRFVN